MKTINLFLFFLVLMTSNIRAQYVLELLKTNGSPGLTVDESNGYTNIYGSVISNNTFNDAFWANNPADDGIHVSSAGSIGARILNSGQYGVYTASSGLDGFFSQSATQSGMTISSPGSDGVRVLNPGDDGFYAENASNHGVLTSFSTRDGFYSNQSGRFGLHVVNAVDDGIRISGSGSHGIEIPSGITGVYVHDQDNQGVYSYNTGLEAGYFRNSAASNTQALYAAHLDDSKWDIGIGGHARVRTDGRFSLQLDQNDNASTGTGDYFEVLASPAQGGTFKMWVYETGNGGVTGNFSKAGGSFKIDHPLDPENKYLYHSFVESPDMMNVYNGNVVLDKNGEAIVEMEDWFEALNRDYRYQLTTIGGAALVYIAEEIKDGRFKIEGGKPNMKVSWQVTGIRQDTWANENRIKVEAEKESFNKGKFLHPKAWSTQKGNGLQHVTLRDPNANNQDMQYEANTQLEYRQHIDQQKAEAELLKQEQINKESNQ